MNAKHYNLSIYCSRRKRTDANWKNVRIKVDGEMSLVMTVYNMKRSINILGVPELIAKLKDWNPDYKGIAPFVKNRLIYLRNERVLLEDWQLVA